MRNQSPDEKLSGLAFKVAADPYIGTLTFYRLLVEFVIRRTVLVSSKIFFGECLFRKLGEMMQFDEIIFFQMGWFKHQLVMVCYGKMEGQKLQRNDDLKDNLARKVRWICLRDWREGMKLWYIYMCVFVYDPVRCISDIFYGTWLVMVSAISSCYPQVSFHLTAFVLLTNQEMVDNYNNIQYPSWDHGCGNWP